jgi:hypothetical protein
MAAATLSSTTYSKPETRRRQIRRILTDKQQYDTETVKSAQECLEQLNVQTAFKAIENGQLPTHPVWRKYMIEAHSYADTHLAYLASLGKDTCAIIATYVIPFEFDYGLNTQYYRYNLKMIKQTPLLGSAEKLEYDFSDIFRTMLDIYSMGNDLATVFFHWFGNPGHLSPTQYMQTQFERIALDYSDSLLAFLRFDPNFVHEFSSFEPFTILMQKRPKETYPLLKQHMDRCKDCVPFDLLDVFFLEPEPARSLSREYDIYERCNERYYIDPIGKSKYEYFDLIATYENYVHMRLCDPNTAELYIFLKTIQQLICDFPDRIIMRFGKPIRDALANPKIPIYSHYLLNWLKKNFASIVLPILDERHTVVPVFRPRYTERSGIHSDSD